MYSFYGSSIWSSYRQSTFHRLRVSYNNAYRILFNMRRRVSISLTLVTEQYSICTFQALIRKHVACFMIRCANSCNICPANIFTRKTHGKLVANSQEFCVGHVANHVITTWYSCDLAHRDHKSLPLISHVIATN